MGLVQSRLSAVSVWYRCSMAQGPPDQSTNSPSASAPAWRTAQVSRQQVGMSPQVDLTTADVRKKIHPRSVSCTFNNWRIAMVWFTQRIFDGLPWLQWNGRQAV